MLPFYKKYARTAFDITLIILTVWLFMSLFSFLFNIATPIFIGILIYLIIEPLAQFLHKKGMKKTLATTISTSIFALVIIGIIATIGTIIVSQIHQLSISIPKYAQSVQVFVDNNADYIKGKIDTLPPDTLEKAKEQSSKFIEKVSGLISAFLLGIFSTLNSISKIVVNLLIGLILAYFLSLEITSWKNFFRKNTPKTFKKVYSFLKENVIKGISKYVKAQLILVSITFIVVLISFLILGIENAIALAFLAAILDLLPLVGMPVLIFPWVIYSFIIGNKFLAFSLLGIWGALFIFRQIAEPKIAGDSLGVSAFTMLAFMIISLSIFGIAGLILSPILIILIKELFEQGYLRQWIHLPEDEFDKEPESETSTDN